MVLKYPVYIVSKGRHDSRLTVKALDKIGIDFKIIIERQEFNDYASVINPHKILILPQSYLNDYEVCDSLGDSLSKGPGAARNFAWDHALNLGYTRHWVLDDNLDDFHRLNKNIKSPVRTNATFIAAEDFVDRYVNVYIAGFNYYSFCKTTDKMPPFVANTRIYSTLLIQNDIPYRWRGRYNEDTDLSLRVLKDGFCTIQFNAFLQGKVTTQRMRGGNTKEFYKDNGTLPKSEMIQKLHPDVASVVWRFNRWHHKVDYSQYKSNKLIKKDNIHYKNKINNYNMILCDE